MEAFARRKELIAQRQREGRRSGRRKGEQSSYIDRNINCVLITSNCPSVAYNWLYFPTCRKERQTNRP